MLRSRCHVRRRGNVTRARARAEIAPRERNSSGTSPGCIVASGNTPNSVKLAYWFPVARVKLQLYAAANAARAQPSSSDPRATQVANKLNNGLSMVYKGSGVCGSACNTANLKSCRRLAPRGPSR